MLLVEHEPSRGPPDGLGCYSCLLVGEADAARVTSWFAGLATGMPPIVVVAREYEPAAAALALERGAHDYVEVDDARALARAIDHAIARQLRLDAQRRAQLDLARSRCDPRTGALDADALGTVTVGDLLGTHRDAAVAALLVRCVSGPDGPADVAVTTARRLRLHARASDVLVRVRGDAFVLLLPSTDAVDARAFGARVRHALSTHPAANGCPPEVAVFAVRPHARFDELRALAAAARPAASAAASSPPSRPRWHLQALRGDAQRARDVRRRR